MSSKNFENLLNSKIFFLNKSSSKFVIVGISNQDFSPKIIIGGKNGFSITLSEESWNSFCNHRGVIENYFCFPQQINEPMLNIDNFKLYFEKVNSLPVIKIKEEYSRYVYLGYESIETLWRLKEVVDYRISIIKKQEFSLYFKVFQTSISIQEGDPIDNIYRILQPNQNPNSENVSTMLEFLILYPEELEKRLKRNELKRKYYEEIGDFSGREK